MFLMSLLQHLKKSYFVDGGNGTKAGIIDYLFANQPRYLFITSSMANSAQAISGTGSIVSTIKECVTKSNMSI